MAMARTELIEKSCVVCGNLFPVCPPGKTSRYCTTPYEALYCSRKCRHDGRYRQGTPCRELTLAQAAYIAGFLDGEGSIILFRRKTGVAMRVSFSNSNQAVLTWIKDTTGVGNQIATKPDDNEKHKPGLFIFINMQSAYDLLKQIEQYMLIKQEQARLAIEFYERLQVPAQKVNKVWQYEYQARMKELNRRGPAKPLALPASADGQ